MIIVGLKGGLGNQLFQYAAARQLAIAHHVPLKLDLSFFFHNKLRKYALYPFHIAENIASEKEIMMIKEKARFQEKFFHFDADIIKINPPVYLDGYWQSEKYFASIANIIRWEFRVRNHPNQENEQMAQKIMDSEAVSLHIRRGDFASNPETNQYHGLCPVAYYHRAVQKVARMLNNPFFFIFSDDWTWAMENICLDYPAIFVTINSADDCHEDLRLMRLCKHHIVANSTFSWWGAWLTEFSAKQVFVPSKWLNNDLDTRDLIPGAWIHL